MRLSIESCPGNSVDPDLALNPIAPIDRFHRLAAAGLHTWLRGSLSNRSLQAGRAGVNAVAPNLLQARDGESGELVRLDGLASAGGMRWGALAMCGPVLKCCILEHP